ncbi:phenoloxidase-activating factor 2 [Diabrotica virgifera virgifera]|uniref:Peptidase S1 domain-containing protein n=1 Tax=Diabrotica virgifera virgifera TaxID=50390 RepID=A0ABM5IWJ4_DIAVI|nr:phenoloxidase-activating factor 2 [Diabrotica virgifera virgifera]
MFAKILMVNYLTLVVVLFVVADGQLDEEFNQIIKELDDETTTVQPETTTTPLSLDPYQNNKDPYAVPGNVSVSCDYQCVPFYQCNNGTLVTNGENIIDIRSKESCGNALLSCCKDEHVTHDRFTPTPPEVPVPQGCGYRRTKGVGFEITGTKDNEAQYAEFPWMVSIYRLPKDANSRPVCGGALIHPQAVITAAHCVQDKRQRFEIGAGEWDISGKIKPFPVQLSEVESVTIHPEFYAGALFNDIALLKLTTPINLSENIDTICLPSQNLVHKPKKRCYSTGWGKDKFGRQGVYKTILKKIDLPVVPKNRCQDYLRKTRLGEFFQLHYSFMCAGGEKGKDSCNGDGGSPLVCAFDDDKDRYYHAGIVAWGIGCGEKKIPGVYTDLAVFRNWIDGEMSKKRLPTTFYDRSDPFIPRIKNGQKL